MTWIVRSSLETTCANCQDLYDSAWKAAARFSLARPGADQRRRRKGAHMHSHASPRRAPLHREAGDAATRPRAESAPAAATAAPLRAGAPTWGARLQPHPTRPTRERTDGAAAASAPGLTPAWTANATRARNTAGGTQGRRSEARGRRERRPHSMLKVRPSTYGAAARIVVYDGPSRCGCGVSGVYALEGRVLVGMPYRPIALDARGAERL